MFFVKEVNQRTLTQWKKNQAKNTKDKGDTTVKSLKKNILAFMFILCVHVQYLYIYILN